MPCVINQWSGAPTATPSSWRRVDGVEVMIEPCGDASRQFDSCTVSLHNFCFILVAHVDDDRVRVLEGLVVLDSVQVRCF